MFKKHILPIGPARSLEEVYNTVESAPDFFFKAKINNFKNNTTAKRYYQKKKEREIVWCRDSRGNQNCALQMLLDYSPHCLRPMAKRVVGLIVVVKYQELIFVATLNG